MSPQSDTPPQARRHHPLSAEFATLAQSSGKPLTNAPGRIRTRDPPLRRSFHATGRPAVSLIRASFPVIWLRLSASGFRRVLARSRHVAWMARTSENTIKPVMTFGYHL
jgi:hypothetical protein